MKYIITRASNWNNEKPCEEAIKEDGIEGWIIEANCIEDLLKYGRLIVDDSFCKKYPTEIKIYDDWIE